MKLKDLLAFKKKRYLAILAVFIVVLLCVFIFGVLLSCVLVSSTPKITPTTPYYLSLPPNKGNSSVLLLSATVKYGNYPFSSISPMGSQPGVQRGESCLIINVTVRNDYTSKNPLPEPHLAAQNDTIANIYITAQVFNQQGIINATDVTPPYPPTSYPGALIYNLQSGQSTIVTIYLATNHHDIDHFVIIPEYIGEAPPP